MLISSYNLIYARGKLTECQFLESSTGGLGVEEENECKFKSNPTTVDGEELPSDSGHGNRIDVLGEETSELAENLLDSDTTSSLCVWEKFDEVGL